MIDQVLNMKKRYLNLVKEFTPKDFEGWFAEFFNRYPFIYEVNWENEYDIIHEPALALSQAYQATHPGLEYRTEDDLMEIVQTKESKVLEYPELVEAIADLKHLLSAEDVIFSALGREVLVFATKHSLKIVGWDKGVSYVTGADSHQSD